MSILPNSGDAMFGPVGYGDPTASSGFTARRCFVWSGSPPSAVLPAAGVQVDGVSGQTFTGVVNPNPPPATITITPCFFARVPGSPFQVEASAAFAAGAALVVDATGRVATGAGTTIATALGASAGAGSIVWAKFA